MKIADAPAFLRCPGEMPQLIKAFDWSATPLGPLDDWPQSLKTTVGMMVAAPNPMVLLWGSQGTLIYNDSYARFAGLRHPELLGMGAREGWPEIADFNDDNIRRGLAGEAWSLEGQELVLDRRGVGPESAWLDLHYTPVRDESDAPAGVLVFVHEITDRVRLGVEKIEARERFDLALSAGRGVGAWDWDVQTDIVRADRRFARLYGVEPEAAERGAPIAEFFKAVHPDDLPRLHLAIDHTLKTGAPFSAEYRLKQGDEIHWVLAEGRCVLSPDGSAIRLPGVSFDISDRKRVEARQAALLDLHNAIRDMEDPVEIAAAAARLSGQVLGCDQAVYASVDIENDALVVEKDWTAEGYVPLAGRMSLRDYGDFIDDLRIGRLVAISDISVHPQTRRAAKAYEARRVRSIVGVPVLERDRLVAILSVNCGRQRNWSAEDLAFLREVAERTRSAVERARAAQALQASEARLRFLDALNLEVARIPDADQILATTTRMICQHLNAAACAYADLDDDQDSLTIRGEWSAPGAPSTVGRYRLTDFGRKTVSDLRDGRPLVADDIAIDLGADAATGFSALGGVKATICMPLVKDGRLIALMAVHSTEARQWTADETALVHEVTERSWAHIERVRSEAERAASEDRYRALFTTMDEGFCVIEFVDGPEGPLSDYVHVDANAAYEQNTGLPHVIGQRMRDMLPGEAEGWVALYRSVLETGRPLRFEKELQATDRWLELAAFRVEPPERRQVAVIFKDLTARKLAEKALEDMNASLEAHVEVRTQELIAAHEALRQSQKMEAVGQLTGGIAHDFNNLLAGIAGSLEIINKRLAQGRAAEIGRYVEAAQGAAQRAAALTQRLLAFSRRQTLDPRPTDVNRLIDGMEELIRRTVGPSVAVEVRGADDLWTVTIDRPQLENALLNLCINARDAMIESGGRLRIETANETLSGPAAAERDLADGDYIALSVTDTGAGIRPEITERIFDPFFTTKPIGQGTGLGLSMIHGFVQQSGGQVQVVTELGAGTTMRLYLPRHDGLVEDIDEPAKVADDVRADGRRVVIIDDEISVRSLVAEVLREQGYSVLEADDGPAGLRLLDGDHDIDLLITDVGLPGGMNGRQVADAARVRKPALKVLFITGYAENAAVGNGLLAPGMEVMTKPFVIADLSARARAMIEKPPA